MSSRPHATQTAAVHPEDAQHAATHPSPSGSPGRRSVARDERQDRRDEEAADDAGAEEPAVSGRRTHDDGQEPRRRRRARPRRLRRRMRRARLPWSQLSHRWASSASGVSTTRPRSGLTLPSVGWAGENPGPRLGRARARHHPRAPLGGCRARGVRGSGQRRDRPRCDGRRPRRERSRPPSPTSRTSTRSTSS